ncbi:MAG: CBS domain-containing protein [Candidatus Odinarchaeota archaeon]|nr:CBS domain-containing protein [Candidatus Odinarchaeota archaeon]
MSLSLTHRQILRVLVQLYYKHKKPVTSKDIASVLRKHDVTIRNAISTLKALNLIEAKPGPGGGYIPTMKAIEIIRIPQTLLPQSAAPLIFRNGMATDLLLTDLELLNLNSPTGDRAIVRVVGDIYNLKTGDYLRIGPTPYSRLIIEGSVIDKDIERGEILIRITTMASIPKEIVRNIMTKDIITVTPDMSVKEVANLLYNNKIRAAPVVKDGALVGLVSSTDLLRVIYEGKIDLKIGEVANKKVLTIREDGDILDAILLMIKNNIGRLIVVDDEGKMIGIVTRTDLLRKIAGL